MQRIPGGGKNDRRAMRLGAEGKWEPCEFEELVPGNIAVLLEADGTPVKMDETDTYTFYVAKPPYQDDAGNWGMCIHSCATLAKFNPPELHRLKTATHPKPTLSLVEDKP